MHIVSSECTYVAAGVSNCESGHSRSCTAWTCCYVHDLNKGVPEKNLIRLLSIAAGGGACFECFSCSKYETGTDLRQKRAGKSLNAVANYMRVPV